MGVKIPPAFLAASLLTLALLPAQAQDPGPRVSPSPNPTEKSAASENTAGNNSQANPTHPTHAEIIAANSVADSRYTNSVLGLSFEIPSGMSVEGARTLKEIEDAGHRAARGSDPASDPVHQQAEVQTIHLWSLVDRPAKGDSAPAQMLVLAYDLGSAKVSNEEVVAGIAGGMMAGPGDWRVIEPVRELEYTATKFSQEKLKGFVRFSSYSVSVYVEILATQCKGYALAWSLTASSRERLDSLAKSLDTMRLAPACAAPEVQR